MIWKYFEWTKNEGTSNHYHLDILSSFLIFIMMIQANTCHLLTLLTMQLNTTLATLLTLYNTCKFKHCNYFIVGICRCMNELVTLVIHLAQKSKHIVKMLVLHTFPFLSKAWDDKCWMNVMVWRRTKMWMRDGKDHDCWKPMTRDSACLCYCWNPVSSSANTSSLDKSVPICTIQGSTR